MLARFGLNQEAVDTLNRLYLLTNRTADAGSYVEAVRLFVASPGCPQGFREWFAMAQRADPHRLPPSLRKAMAKSKPRMAWDRAPKRAELDRGLHGTGRLRYHETEDRRLYAGEVEVWDDGSVNFICWIPWPWGGCRVSDRWGVKVGRFQLLAAIDAASSFCHGFSFVARPAQSYRAEDIAAAMVRLWGVHGRPTKLLLERASWEAKRVADLALAAEIDVRHTYTPRHKLIEPWFGRVWLRSSSAERVSVGRFRRDDEAGAALYERLKSGSIDPRLHCQSLPELVGVVEAAVQRSNQEPIGSKEYGIWIPAERWQTDIAAHALRRPLEQDFAWSHAPEIREWTVRKSHVEGTLEHPLLGTPQAYSFAWPDAWRCEGKRVRVHFDPAADLCRATVFAVDAIPEAGAKPGDKLAERAESLSDIPTILPGGEIDWDGGATERTRQMTIAQRKARATEFRALLPDGRRAAWASEVRTPDGKTISTEMTTIPRPASTESTEPKPVALPTRTAARLAPPAPTPVRPDPTDDDLAALNRLEQRARNAGLIPHDEILTT